jgi:ribosomal protein S18 acetylase RimI-like enzyme
MTSATTSIALGGVALHRAHRQHGHAVGRAVGRRHLTTTTAAAASERINVERARGGDYNAAAATFVKGFFFDGASDVENEAEFRSLTRAQTSDLKKRYDASGRDGSALLVIRDNGSGSSKILACGGVEVRSYVGATDYETYVKQGRGGMDVELNVVERPVVANLATAPEARRKGYGKAIMRALEEVCLENGYDECVLVVDASNKRAQALYKKLGYKVIGGDKKAAALKVVNGRARETTTKTLVMRKSLTNGLENIDVASIGAIVAVLAALAAQKDAILDAMPF